MITIECKYNSVLILRAGQLGALKKYTSRLEGNKLISNRTNLLRTSNKYCCKYNHVALRSFGQTDQLTIVTICHYQDITQSTNILKTAIMQSACTF